MRLTHICVTMSVRRSFWSICQIFNSVFNQNVYLLQCKSLFFYHRYRLRDFRGLARNPIFRRICEEWQYALVWYDSVYEPAIEVSVALTSAALKNREQAFLNGGGRAVMLLNTLNFSCQNQANTE